jgi:hypothetical protein
MHEDLGTTKRLSGAEALRPKETRQTPKPLILALTLALASTLTLTWVLSLRAVRLKIGEYYFNRGNFDQAINWYQTQQR